MMVRLAVVGAFLAACSGSEPRDVVPLDSPPSQDDAAVGGGSPFPAWMLEDVQPLSPMVGQTYGLDTFLGRVVVVCLLEGF